MERQPERGLAAEGGAHQVEVSRSSRSIACAIVDASLAHARGPVVLGRLTEPGHLEGDDPEVTAQEVMRRREAQPARAMEVHEWGPPPALHVSDPEASAST